MAPRRCLEESMAKMGISPPSPPNPKDSELPSAKTHSILLIEDEFHLRHFYRPP